MLSLKIATIYISSPHATFWGILGAIFVLALYYWRRSSQKVIAPSEQKIKSLQQHTRPHLVTGKQRKRIIKVTRIRRR